MNASPRAYAPPLSDLLPVPDAESERRAYLSHEAAVRSVGSLYLLGALICALASLVLLLTDDVGSGAALVYAALSAFQVILAWGLYRLDPRVRLPVGLCSTLGLLVLPPLGTLLNAYALYLLFSPKGEHVFSSTYREVIGRTPTIRYERSPIAAAAVLCAIIGLLLLTWAVVA